MAFSRDRFCVCQGENNDFSCKPVTTMADNGGTIKVLLKKSDYKKVKTLLK